MSKKVEKNILKTLKKKERFSSYSDEGVRSPRVAEKKTKISNLKKSESPLYKEYIKKRNNTQSILRRAKNDDIDVSDIVLPNVPQVISEGSVRRMTDIHDKVKKEVAKRRRIKDKIPPRPPRTSLDNLEAMIQKAVNYDGMEPGDEWERSDVYVDMVNQSGEAAQNLLDYMKAKHERDIRAKYKGHSQEWYDVMSEIALIKGAEEVIRKETARTTAFLWGYAYPEDPPKPSYYAAIRELLGYPLTPKESERLLSTGQLEFVDAEMYE